MTDMCSWCCCFLTPLSIIFTVENRKAWSCLPMQGTPLQLVLGTSKKVQIMISGGCCAVRKKQKTNEMLKKKSSHSHPPPLEYKKTSTYVAQNAHRLKQKKLVQRPSHYLLGFALQITVTSSVWGIQENQADIQHRDVCQYAKCIILCTV